MAADKKRHESNRRRKRKGMCLEDRPCLEPSAAGIDIGAREIYVAVPPDRDDRPVRVFETFTEDLHRMAGWPSAQWHLVFRQHVQQSSRLSCRGVERGTDSGCGH